MSDSKKLSKCFNYTWRTHQVEYDWKAWCREWGKHWSYQLEEGDETHRKHFQGIISLKTKRTKPECISVMKPLPEFFEPVANANLKGGSESFYVTKPDTRIDGPWTDKDEELFIPYHLDGKELTLFPWQKTIWDSGATRNSRKINVVVETTGNVGKSTLVGLMRVHKRAVQIPPLNDPDKLSQVALCILSDKNIRDPKVMLIDIPRAIKQESLAGMYAACEQIKDGWVYDWRNHWKEWTFHPPQVWVFTNTIPHAASLSFDRWNLWEICLETNDLKALRWKNE